MTRSSFDDRSKRPDRSRTFGQSDQNLDQGRRYQVSPIGQFDQIATFSCGIVVERGDAEIRPQAAERRIAVRRHSIDAAHRGYAGSVPGGGSFAMAPGGVVQSGKSLCKRTTRWYQRNPAFICMSSARGTVELSGSTEKRTAN